MAAPDVTGVASYPNTSDAPDVSNPQTPKLQNIIKLFKVK